MVHAYNLLPRNLPECDRIPLLDEPVLLALQPEAAWRRGAEAGLSDLADLC